MRKKISIHFKNNRELYLIALNLGLTGFGGLAVINRIKEEYVIKREIISEQKFLHTLSLAQILPGSTIINLIAFFNYLSAGLMGALIGTAIYIFPTFLITALLIKKFLIASQSSGLKPSRNFLIVSRVIFLLSR